MNHFGGVDPATRDYILDTILSNFSEGASVIISTHLIADIEKMHGRRFEEIAKLMEDGKLFVSDVKTGWMCLGCGYVVESDIAPQNCPVCDSGQGFFIRMSMAPYVCNR